MNRMPSRQQSHPHQVDFIAVLILFGVFVLSGVLLIRFGTHIYENILSSMNSNDDRRTAIAYITQKVRQNNEAGAIEAGEFDGHSALLLHQTFNNADYITYLYENEGSLCELFCAANAELTAGAGSAILPVQSVDFEDTDQGILVKLVTADGSPDQFVLHTIQTASAAS